jgi:AraC-like DNA-binding protein
MQKRTIPIDPFGQEHIHYDNPGFPSISYHTLIRNNSAGYIPLHWHDEWQFQRVVAGQVKMYVEGEEVLLTAGDSLWINSGVIHEAHGVTDDAQYACWNIQPTLLPEVLQRCVTQKGPTQRYMLFTDKAWHEKVHALIETGTTSDDEFMIYEAFVQLAHLLCQHAERQHVRTAFDDRMKQLLSYIHTHYRDKITLDELANVVYLSDSETIRLFKKSLQLTPFQYILKYRLEKSRELLKHTDHAVTTIALEVGFSSASYFIQKFKEAYGITPKQFQMV